MESIQPILAIIVILSTIWVGYDTHRLKIKGLWTLGTLFLWIIVFPFYLIHRQKYLPSETNDVGSPGASDSAQFCKHCGKPLPSDSRFCKHCGKEQ